MEIIKHILPFVAICLNIEFGFSRPVNKKRKREIELF